MASIASMNPQTLGELLGREISDAVVLVAKSLILGGDEHTVAASLGATLDEVRELMETQDYKDVYLVLASHYRQQSVQTDLSYDDIEARTLGLLSKKLDSVKEVDQMLKIIAVTNKAIRRNKPVNQDTLDPSGAGQRVHLTLSRRIVEKLQGADTRSREEIQEISISGRGLNPSFEDVDKFFGVKQPRVEENYRLGNETVIDLEQLGRDLDGKS